ncbi:gamma-glutamyltransferase [Roseovarius spongiae]|uniref:Glutathione hydrolase proenzyme n=1 Tax=Roseovarius spongiae TaxID=2320272 RepID=A0A3A8AW08_9RHOB|nr:gamma-glutamyltransferase [Roseovarius spongiae]RKF15358.1 gamma-glutamyltransferase [Roseovarius spongiae]
MRLLTVLCLCLALPVAAQQAADAVAPEAGGAAAQATSTQVAEAQRRKAAGIPVEAGEWMIVAAHPLAAEAGARMLREGGTAADALVAVQLVLGLVEPQSSGLGGGAFLVWWDAASGALTTLDGRETAPLMASPRMFQTKDGAPMAFMDAVPGGLSVGTPGTPALLHAAHRRWGRLAWAPLFDDAIRLAEDGFDVSERMAASIAGKATALAMFPDTAAYFLPGGAPLPAGARLRNPAYADTLRAFAAEGPDVFYTGRIGRAIVAAVQGARVNPGLLSEVDLAIYRVRERPAICAPYRGHKICGMGPPSSGALTVGQTLGLLSGFDLGALGPMDAEARRLIGDAARLAFADRGRYMADSDYVPMPTRGLLDLGYLAGRADLLRGDDALPEVAPGRPEFDHAAAEWSADGTVELPSTSHISIVDRYGNALSMTTTIESGFGSRLMVGGFLLNNELTDFSFRSHEDGVPVANRVEPGKRPRSSMAPTIVMRDGSPVLLIGSPGGSRIIGYVTNALIAILDWGMNVQQAAMMPHMINRWGAYDLEAGTAAEALAEPLRTLGYEVKLQEMTSGLHAVALRDGLLFGGADPRREGVALGE